MRDDLPSKENICCVGECFIAGTLVLTQQGLIPIEQVTRGDIVFTQSGTAPVIDLYEMPEQDLLKIALENGVSVTITTAQPLRVIKPNLEYEWKQACEILQDDYVVVRASYPTELPYVRLSDWQDRAVILDEDLAYVMGQFLSDGWFERENTRFAFQSITRGVIERVQKALAKIFNYSGNIEELVYRFVQSDGVERDTNAYKFRINSKSLNTYLCDVFQFTEYPHAATKRIPLQFFQSPKSVLGDLFSGMIDGDGSVRPDYSHIHYGTVSEQLADDVQLLLQHLGIFSTRYTTNIERDRGNVINGRKIQANYPFHAIEIDSRYAQRMGRLLNLSHETKHQRIQRMLTTKLKVAKYDRIPYAGAIVFQELSRQHIGAGWYQDQAGNKFRMGIKYPGGSKIRYSKDLYENPLGRTQVVEWGISEKLTKLGSPLSPFINGISANDTYFLQVANTHRAPSQKVYDLRVSGDQEFIANGIVSHSCLI